MEKTLNTEYEHYYDGIPPEVSQKHAEMSIEELEKEIEEEKKRCDQMKHW